MMEFFEQLHHLETYGNPQYFDYVIAAILPIFIGLLFKKRFAWYEVLVSLIFIVTMMVGGKTNQLAIYHCCEILLLLLCKHYRTCKDVFKKRFAWYEVLVSLFLIVTMLVGGKTNQLAIYLCWEILLLLFYKHYRKSKDGKWVFYLVSFLSLLPIIFVKVQLAINGT